MDKHRKNQKAALSGILAIIFFALTVFFTLPYLQQSPYQAPIKLTIGVESSILSAAVWVADNKGYFIDEGIDPSIQKYDSGKLSFQALLSDNGPDIATVAPTPIMFNSMVRNDFAIFATFVSSSDDLKIITHNNRNITTAQDLRGKRVATPFGTTGQFFIESYLTENQMHASDIHLIDIPPSELPGALQDGQVDAIVIWEPHAFNARQRLADMAVRLASQDIYRETFNFIAMKEFTKAHPQVVVRFLRAIVKATDYLNTHKQESQKIVAQRLNLKQENIAAVWDDFHYELTLRRALLTTLEDEARWAIRSGFTEQSEVPNYLDLIYFNAMDEILPLAVDIIH